MPITYELFIGFEVADAALLADGDFSSPFPHPTASVNNDNAAKSKR
jgi:hypothetical protein